MPTGEKLNTEQPHQQKEIKRQSL